MRGRRTEMKCYTILIGSFFFIILILSNIDKSNVYLRTARYLKVPFKQQRFTPNLFEAWHDCATKNFLDSEENSQNFWNSFKKKSKNCVDISAIKNVTKVISLRNKDETKYAILPIQKSGENVFVTLGIGLDTTAEVAFAEKMKQIKENVSFYGADPIIKGNAELYSKIGKFFPFAVGAKAGFSSASVLKNGRYVNTDVVYIDLFYFIKEVLRKNIIDYLWMDNEYAEYGLLDIFFENEKLDQLRITFCQTSLEVHLPNEAQRGQFMTFIKRLVEEKRFGFFFSENVGHIRMWLFNFGSEYCTQKFFKSV